MARDDQQEKSLNAPLDRLDSWKEIAAYLRRGVRTVQRWEQSEKLPVHRHFHDKRSSVYAFRSELDTWRENRSFPPETSPQLAPPPVQVETPAAQKAVQIQTRRASFAPPAFLLPGKPLSTVATALLLVGFATAVAWAIAEIRTHVAAAHVGLMAQRLVISPSRAAFRAATPDATPPAPAGSECASPASGQRATSSRPFPKLSAPQTAIVAGRRLVFDISPTWSPDGRQIAFLRSFECDRASLFVAPAAGGAARRLLDVRLPIRTRGPYLGWTSDSKNLVIRGGRSPDDLHEWFLYSLTTGEQRYLSGCEASSLTEANSVAGRSGRGSIAGS